jgi:hypothetical protein
MRPEAVAVLVARVSRSGRVRFLAHFGLNRTSTGWPVSLTGPNHQPDHYRPVGIGCLGERDPVRPVSARRNSAALQSVKVGRDPPKPLQTRTLNAPQTRLRACPSTSSNACPRRALDAPSNTPPKLKKNMSFLHLRHPYFLKTPTKSRRHSRSRSAGPQTRLQEGPRPISSTRLQMRSTP